MRRWDHLVERYLEELRARGLAAETITQATRELDRWGAWLKRRRPRVPLEAVGAEHVVGYIQGRAAFRSKATVSSILSTLRGMGGFLVRQEIWSSNPLRWMRGPRLDARSRLPRRIGRQAMTKVWTAAATRRRGYHRYLWVTILSVLYGTGLRRGELERLDLSDWDREQGTLTIDGRKTGQQRRVAVPETVWRCLEAYLPQRHNLLEGVGDTGQGALFVNQSGDRLRGTSISRAIRSLGEASGVGRITLHQFRHSCASDLLAEGVRLPEIQAMLGHQTIATTMRYLHVADPQLHEAVRRHPINEILPTGDPA